MNVKGIDISSYNNVRDYDSAAADGVEFAILKIIRKDLTPDNRFEVHWRGCESAGIPIQGVYNYSYATDLSKFRSDAKRVIEILSGRRTMVWLDIEDKCLTGLGRTLADGINAYADIICSAGLSFGVYTGLSYYNSYLRPYAAQLRLPYWIARYPSGLTVRIEHDPESTKRPDVGQQLYGWQFSSKGKINGIDGNVDLNEWYVDLEAQNTAPAESSYITDGFRRDMAAALCLPAEAAAAEVLDRTVTISSKFNRHHAAVTPLERLLRTLGYYSGAVEADQGKRPNFGAGMSKATKLYQSQIVGYRSPDAVWSARNKSYAKALRM